MMGMVQNGCFAMTVALGIIGAVLHQCLLVTLNLNSPFNVPQKTVGSSNIKWDFASKTSPTLDLHLDLKRDKNYDPVFLLRMGPKIKYSKKGWKKVKRTPAQSHYKEKNLLYPANLSHFTCTPGLGVTAHTPHQVRLFAEFLKPYNFLKVYNIMK